MEEAILHAEAEASRLGSATADPAVLADHSRATAAFAELAAATDRVRSLYERWAELERIAAGEEPRGASRADAPAANDNAPPFGRASSQE